MLRIGGPCIIKESHVIAPGADLIAIGLYNQAIHNSTIVTRNREMLIETIDYSVSYNDGLTILTWIGDIAQGGIAQLIPGDRISVIYHQFH